MAMQLANALLINFRRGCSVLEIRFGMGVGGFAVALTCQPPVAAFVLYSAA